MEFEKQGMLKKLKEFFRPVFIAGALLVLAGFVLAQWENIELSWASARDIASKTFVSIGIALLIGSIFSFLLNTAGFLAYISSMLERIVVSKEFVGVLSSEEKKELLLAATGPAHERNRAQYEIQTYFDMCIEKMMDRFDGIFRGQMKIDAVARFDPDKEKIVLEWDTYHVVYRSKNGFEPILFHMNRAGFEHKYTRLEAGDEKIKEIYDASEFLADSELVAMEKQVSIDVPEEWEEFEEIAVKRRIVEDGHDHWALFMYKSTKPCHKLLVSLKCQEGIKIREHGVFGMNDKVRCIFDENDPTSIEYSYNEWLDEGYGVLAIVSLDQACRDS